MKKHLQKVEWEKQNEEGVVTLSGLICEAVWEIISVLLLIFAAVSMLSVLSYRIETEGSDSFKIVFAVTLTVLFYEVGVRALLSKCRKAYGKYLRIILAVLPFAAVFSFMLLYYAKMKDEIGSGLAAAMSYFLKPYNRIYGANIVFKSADDDYLSMGLCFAALLIFFVLYFFSRLGKRKWLFVLLPFAAASVLMYVGLTPGWYHIIIAAAGIYMTLRRGSGRGWFLGAAVSAAVFVLLAFMAGFVLSGPADRLLSHSDDVKAFQDRLEKSINSAFSRVFLASDRTLDNSSPRYKDAEIMQVTVDKVPTGNLYFKDFYGVDYDYGTWTVNMSDFTEACKENGADPEEVALKLAGSEYKNKNYEHTGFEIKYSGLLGQAMLLPYSVNVKGIKDLSFKGDFIAKKNLTEKSISFEGIRTNSFNTTAVFPAGEADTSEEKEFWSWYADYVNDTCLYVPEYIFKTRAYRELDEMRRHRASDENRWRLEMVKQVFEYLSEHYTYSWELESLDADTDPLEHFLKKGRKGYCMHFASAGTIILRSLGVPARYASGYVLKPFMFEKNDDGSYSAVVLDRNAHAWVEVFYEGIGWIPYEMTPGYESGTGEFPAGKEAAEKRKEEEKPTPIPTFSPTPTVTPAVTLTTAPTKTPTPSVTRAPGQSPTPKPSLKPGISVSPNESSSSAKGGKNAESGESGNGGSGSSKQVLVIVLIVLCSFAAAFAVVRARRKQLRKIETALKNKYYRAAVKMMNRRVYRRLRRKGGIKGRNTTDKKLEETLLEVLGEDRKKEIDEYMRVVKKAAFSENAVSKAESEAVARLYRLI